jgi:hypothetical protein
MDWHEEYLDGFSREVLTDRGRHLGLKRGGLVLRLFERKRIIGIESGKGSEAGEGLGFDDDGNLCLCTIG